MIRDERGITLTELLVALAITALIIGTLATAIFQIFDITGRGNNELVVQHDLQNAATWLNRDVLSASSAKVSGSQMMTLTIPYVSAATVLTRTIIYTHSAADRTLIRNSGDSMATVARNVDSIVFSKTGTVTSTITITITSRASDVTQIATLHLDMRPTE
jgi:Tfp pilus assembly protein PilW